MKPSRVFSVLLMATSLSGITANAATPDINTPVGALDLSTLANTSATTASIMTIVTNTTHQTADLHGNQLDSGMTGNNTAGANAFNGSTGISTLIQNTGNQVLIQQTTQLNVLFKP